jgi:F0F1-type ATP synthase membrane subunit a
MKSPLEQFDIINVKSINTMTMDISFNNILVPFLFTIIIFIFFLFLYNNRFNLISSYFQSIFEMVYIFLVGLIKQQAHSYGLF